MAYKRNFSTAYTGTATTLSSSYYMRNFYVSNRDARTATGRAGFDTNSLSMADGMALRRAIRQLGTFSYDDTQADNIRNGVLAYISTYNNALSSVADSSDDTMEYYGKQMKSLTNSYAGELDKIGITVGEDGTLKSRESLFQSADIAKFEKLFARDSDYMQRVTACAKRIQTRSEALFQSQGNRQFISDKTPDTTTTDSASGTQPDTTVAAQLVAQSMDLDVLLNTGIGKNVNISL